MLIKSKENPLIKHISKLIKSAGYRQQSGEYVTEGMRLCRDALSSGILFSGVLFSEAFFNKNTELCAEFTEKSAETYVLTDSLFKSISDTKTPQGIMCICKINPTDILLKQKGNYIALQNIQDPSNMGTIMRTAEALGINGILCSVDCCDVYSPKVLRGSMGAIFRLPIAQVNNMQGFLEHTNQLGFITLAAVPSTSAEKITEINLNGSVVAFIGNEGNGLTNDIITLCTKRVTIPMNGRAESLNAAVAASIIMWEMVK